jgi:hypothetical protein
VLVILNYIFIFVFLNIFVIILVSVPEYVKSAHFDFCICCELLMVELSL